MELLWKLLKRNWLGGRVLFSAWQTVLVTVPDADAGMLASREVHPWAGHCTCAPSRLRSPCWCVVLGRAFYIDSVITAKLAINPSAALAEYGLSVRANGELFSRYVSTDMQLPSNPSASTPLLYDGNGLSGLFWDRDTPCYMDLHELFTANGGLSVHSGVASLMGSSSVTVLRREEPRFVALDARTSAVRALAATARQLAMLPIILQLALVREGLLDFTDVAEPASVDDSLLHDGVPGTDADVPHSAALPPWLNQPIEAVLRAAQRIPQAMLEHTPSDELARDFSLDRLVSEFHRGLSFVDQPAAAWVTSIETSVAQAHRALGIQPPSAPRARGGAAQAIVPAAKSRSEVDAFNAQADHFLAALVVECSAEEMASRAARSASVPCHSSGAAVAAPGTVPANDEI